jgi:hypothetical protein
MNGRSGEDRLFDGERRRVGKRVSDGPSLDSAHSAKGPSVGA